jgi:hypothetical protein
MVPAIYILEAATNLLCAILLFRGYRRSKGMLLLWSGLFFGSRVLTNVLVFVDLIVVPNIDLYPLRVLVALIGTAMLVYGLVWGER